MWIDFKYERLPNFCYICDCLDHNDKDCDRELELKHERADVYLSYGPWICVEMYSPSKPHNNFSASRNTSASPNHSVNDEECSSRYSPAFSSLATIRVVAAART